MFQLGNIPGPIVFAAIIDRSCIQWTKSPPSINKTCRLYNNHRFSLGMGLLGSVIRFCSAVSALITLYFVFKMNKFDVSHTEKDIEPTTSGVRKDKADGEINEAFEDTGSVKIIKIS